MTISEIGGTASVGLRLREIYTGFKITQKLPFYMAYTLLQAEIFTKKDA
jgi:hypothetical protein